MNEPVLPDEPNKVVPRDFEGNLHWRVQIERWCAESESNRQVIIDACNRDLLFWVNTFVWTYNPRQHPDHPIRPFITWPFQERALIEIDASIGRRNVILPKSRYVGATWMVLLPIDRRLLFRRMQSFLLVSRTEAMVDKKGDPDCLFWKLDFIHSHLPPWMTGGLQRNKLSLVNTANGSTIMGTSTTGDIGRGGRKTAIIPDEFAFFERSDSRPAWAAIAGNTNSAIVPSTPNGIGNEFYRLAHDPNRKVIRLHWTEHPEQRAGAYRLVGPGKKPVLIDEEYWRKTTVGRIRREYGEIQIEGDDRDLARDHYPWGGGGFGRSEIRSPYYDNECLKIGVDSLIAQELDIDFLQSGSPFFSADEIVTIIEKHCRDPFKVGELMEEEGSIVFRDSPGGRLHLWLNLAGGKPPEDRKYVAGADVSAGSGASNSCLAVYDTRTMEKVARVKTSRLRPEKFADYCHTILKWFGFPRLWFEMQGVGKDFGARLRDLKYPALYRHTSEKGKQARHPGWPSTAEARQNLLERYGTALVAGRIINRDEEAVRECLEYRWTSRGTVEHSSAMSLDDPSGARKNHGDLVIADAGCWLLLKSYQRRQEDQAAKRRAGEPVSYSPFCMAARMREREEAQRRRESW